MWFVANVVAMGRPSAWRKVLYCMEAMKLTVTCEICTGASSGSSPSAVTKSISTAMNSVSQRNGQAVLDGVGQQLGDERAQQIGADRDQVVERAAPVARAERHPHEHDVAPSCALQNTPPRSR